MNLMKFILLQWFLPCCLPIFERSEGLSVGGIPEGLTIMGLLLLKMDLFLKQGLKLDDKPTKGPGKGSNGGAANAVPAAHPVHAQHGLGIGPGGRLPPFPGPG